MLNSSFIFLDGIGRHKEKQLWDSGIKSWVHFQNAGKIKGITAKRKSEISKLISEAESQLHQKNSSYFMDKLTSSEMWRLYPHFRHEAAFLDIETSGVESNSFITVIGIFDGFDTKMFVRGINLEKDAVQKELSKYKLLITFNGSTFDLPMIEKSMPGILPDVPHWDLRHSCAKAGLTGGLKSIEKQVGIKRANPLVERMYGGDAITLWRMFRATGDDYYLKLLIEYNEEDCINLKSLANKVYEKLCATCLS